MNNVKWSPKEVSDAGYELAFNDIKTIINAVVKEEGCNNLIESAKALDRIITLTHMDKENVKAWAICASTEEQEQDDDDKIIELLEQLFDLIEGGM